MNSYLSKFFLLAGIITLTLSLRTGIIEAREPLQEAGQDTQPAPSQTADQEEPSPVNPPTQTLLTDQKAVQEIEKREKATQGEIVQKAEVAETAKKEAAQAITQKEVLEKEAALKEEAAKTTKEELQAVKREAAATQDPQAVEKAKQLIQEAKRLEQEAAISREKATVLGTKARTAEKLATANLDAIKGLQQELETLKKEKVSGRGLIDKLIAAGWTVLVGVLLFLVLNFSIRKFEELVTEKDALRESEQTLRMKTLSALFRWIGSITIIGFLIYSLLEHFGINMAPLLAGAGIAGIAFGFGGQYLIRDIINGVFILLEGQYRINDVVKIGDLSGLVEAVNLRLTRLRDLEGRVIYIPNGEVKTVVNFTKEYAQALLDIGVAYKENVDRVMDIMKTVAKEMREDPYFGRLILGDMEMLGVDAFSDSAVVIKCRIKTLPIKQWEVMREYRRRLKNRFDELGIEIPFPHQTVYWGTGKDNDWWRHNLTGKDH